MQQIQATNIGHLLAGLASPTGQQTFASSQLGSQDVAQASPSMAPNYYEYYQMAASAAQVAAQYYEYYQRAAAAQFGPSPPQAQQQHQVNFNQPNNLNNVHNDPSALDLRTSPQIKQLPNYYQASQQNHLFGYGSSSSAASSPAGHSSPANPQQQQQQQLRWNCQPLNAKQSFNPKKVKLSEYQKQEANRLLEQQRDFDENRKKAQTNDDDAAAVGPAAKISAKKYKGEFDEPTPDEVEERQRMLARPDNYHRLIKPTGSEPAECACVLGSHFHDKSVSSVLSMIDQWRNLSTEQRIKTKWDVGDLPKDIPLCDIKKYEDLRYQVSKGRADFGGASKRKPLGIRGTRQFLLILYCLWGHPGRDDVMQKEGYCPHCFAKIKKANEQSTLVRVVNHFNMKHRRGANPRLSPHRDTLSAAAACEPNRGAQLAAAAKRSIKSKSKARLVELQHQQVVASNSGSSSAGSDAELTVDDNHQQQPELASSDSSSSQPSTLSPSNPLNLPPTDTCEQSEPASRSSRQRRRPEVDTSA